jgi:class 3 adenylate cyclase/tetratricopeptide (TPR) repeat protein
MGLNCSRCGAHNPTGSVHCFKCAAPLILLEETLPLGGEPQELKAEAGAGPIFVGKYEILEKLGQGGMGAVYKAKDTKLNRFVALKFLSRELTGHPEFKKLFTQEAQAASATEHQNICTIYEIDETAAGQIYIGMALYQGETVKDKIQRGPLPLEGALDIVTQLTQGLSQAHGRAIIHRDIKPANIMVTSEGVIKILDFGLAKLGGLSDLTKTGQVVGTVVYMSPEQARGENVDHRTDLWSVGAVFYQMLTGRLPFKGDRAEAYIHSLLNDQPVPPSAFRDDIPEEAEDIILKCLAKSPQGRYDSADGLLTDLAKLKSALARRAAQLASGQVSGPERTRETERRLATVMFAEIVGYAEMLKSLDVEDAPQVIRRCLTMLSSSCTQYGGKVDKLAENVMMVVFGVPRSLEDAPKKAINAAIEMRENLARFNHDEALKRPLAIRIGIHTGMVIAGPLGPGDTHEYSIMGEPVELALQLKDASSPGEIAVGALTYRYTKNEFDYQELKPLVQKERKGFISAYRLLSAEARVYRAPFGSDRMIFSEMVGRHGELDKLKLLILKAINGEGAVVSIIGEAGIGKSRLIAELAQQDEMKRVNFLLGRALSFGQNLSFHPLIDILKSWAGITDDDTALSSSQKLERAIQKVYPEGVEDVYPFIATLMSIKLSGARAERIGAVVGESLEKLIMKSFRELLVHAAAVRPMVFVIEDLHWADLSSIELLGSLYRLAENSRILFINVFRPDYEETSERLLKTIRTRYAKLATEIYLEPLDGGQCETLVSNLLHTKDLPDHIMGLIAKQAEGNPFFIEEVARSFIDDGIVEKKDGHFYITDKIDSVVIPETIHDVIMARVDKLDEQTKSLLKIASVIGRYFFHSILAAVAQSIREIDDKLEYLKEIQLIRERRYRAELEYLFKHALARESIYSSILLKTRKSLHLSIAQAIEGVFADRLNEFYGMLALHYSLGEDLVKAEEYLVKAGEEALKAAASSEAIHYYQEALRVYLHTHGNRTDPERIAVLEKNIGLAFLHRGRLVDAVAHLDKALALWGWKRPRFRLQALLIFLYNIAYILKGIYFPRRRSKKIPPEGYSETFDLLMKRATALVTYDPFRFLMDSVATIKALIEFDYTKIKNGAVTAHSSSAIFAFTGTSVALSRKINECFEYTAGDEDVKTVLTFNFYKFLNNFLSGKWDSLPAYDEDLIDQNLKIGEFFLAPAYHIFLGLLSAEQGDFDRALFCADKLSRIGEDYENDYSRSRKSLVKGQLLLKQRKLAEALRTVDEEQSFQKAIGQNPLVVLYMLGVKAHVQLIQEDFAGAQETLRAARAITLQKKHIYPYFISNFQIAQFLSDINALEEAVRGGRRREVAAFRKKAFQSGRQALKTSRKYSADKTEIYRLMGILFWVSGKPKKAQDWWERSVKTGEALEARPELGRTYLEIGKRLSEGLNRFKEFEGQNAQACYSKAEALFKSVGLPRDLEELDRLRKTAG